MTGADSSEQASEHASVWLAGMCKEIEDEMRLVVDSAHGHPASADRQAAAGLEPATVKVAHAARRDEAGARRVLR